MKPTREDLLYETLDVLDKLGKHHLLVARSAAPRNVKARCERLLTQLANAVERLNTDISTYLDSVDDALAYGRGPAPSPPSSRPPQTGGRVLTFRPRKRR